MTEKETKCFIEELPNDTILHGKYTTQLKEKILKPLLECINFGLKKNKIKLLFCFNMIVVTVQIRTVRIFIINQIIYY